MSTKTKRSKQTIFNMVLTAVLAAMAIGLYYLEFPIFPAAAFLKLDFSDFPALFAGIFINPGAAVLVELIKNLAHMLTKGLGTQMGFGNLMNFVVGCAYILPVSFLTRSFIKRKCVDFVHMLFASAVGIVTIVVVGLGMNYLIMPLFYQFFLNQEMSRAAIVPLLGFATGINAIKGALLSAEAVLLLVWRNSAPQTFRMFAR